MNRPPSIDPLTEALRNLPRERASAGFTARTLSRLEPPRRRLPITGGRLLAAAAALAVIVAIPWLGDLRQQRQLDEIRHRAAGLRRDSVVLEHQMEEARQRYERQSVLYLGGDDDIDLVLDIRPLTRPLNSHDFQPAALHTD